MKVPRREAGLVRGYTISMKTAVSIPDDVFQRAERLARQTRKSRSQLFSEAVREYVARHAPQDVTEAMDCVCAVLAHSGNDFVKTASRRILERSEW
jgi:antitoxin MazE6